MRCAFCNKPLEVGNDTHFCDEQCEYDYTQENSPIDEEAN